MIRNEWLLMALLIAFALGCHGEVIDPGADVQILASRGDYVKVETADGRRGFVHRNSVGSLSDGHMIRNSAPLYQSPPVAPVALANPDATLADIRTARSQVPLVFMTQHSRRQVVRPMNAVGPLVDRATGEPIWLAYVCNHPDCPHFKQTGERLIFPWVDPLVKEVTPDGTHVKIDLPRQMGPGEYMMQEYGTTCEFCPECMKARQPHLESEQVQERYALLVEPYELPEATRMRHAIDQQHRQVLREGR